MAEDTGLFGASPTSGAVVTNYSASPSGVGSGGGGNALGGGPTPGGGGQAAPSAASGIPGGAGAAITDIFGAGADLIQAYGSFQAANLYGESENLDIENAGLALQAAKVQNAQTGRQLTLTQGAATSAITGNGFNLGGSGLDILRANAQQGALAQAITSEQGISNFQNYEEQASAAKSAENQAKLAGYTGILKAVGAVALLAA